MKNLKPQTILFIIIAFLILFKIKRLELLAYYIDDFSNNLEGTYSWLLGRPITYANGFGKMISAHNYFLMPVLGLVSVWSGIYGMFVLYSIFILLMWLKFNKLFPINTLANAFLFILLFLNPAFLWIYDHPDTGFSMELYYLPFAVLYALALKSGNRTESILWATLLVLVREDGIILACLVHLIATAKSVNFDYARLFQSFKVSFALWVALFFLAIVLLHFRAEEQHTFIKLAAKSMVENLHDRAFYFGNVMLFFKAVVLLMPLGSLLFIVVKNTKNTFTVFVLTNMVLLLLITFQGVKYYELPFFANISATWSIRFILPYSLTICFFVLNIEQKTGLIFTSKYSGITAFVLMFAIQFYLIDRFRNDVDYKEMAKEIYTSKPHEGVSGLADRNDIAKLRDIESVIPDRSNIYIFDFISSIFSEHFVIWWNKGKAYENADIAVLPKNSYDHYTRDLPIYMKPNFKKVMDLNAYSIYATPKYANIINSKMQVK